jgi:hypothetical protein
MWIVKLLAAPTRNANVVLTITQCRMITYGVCEKRLPFQAMRLSAATEDLALNIDDHHSRFGQSASDFVSISLLRFLPSASCPTVTVNLRRPSVPQAQCSPQHPHA